MPINESVVVVVLAPTTGNQPTPPGVLAARRAILVEQLHAQTIWSGPAVSAYNWRPDPGHRRITIPT